MAVTKILARRGGLAQAIAYVVNGDKTEEQVLTATQGCSIKSACAEMQDAKIRWNKTDGVQLYGDNDHRLVRPDGHVSLGAAG